MNKLYKIRFEVETPQHLILSCNIVTMESEEPDDCRETVLEEETEVSEEPVVFNESLWEKSSGKIMREHFKEYKKKPDCKFDIKSIFGWFLVCVM